MLSPNPKSIQVKIKENVQITDKFSFAMVNQIETAAVTNNFNINKPTTHNNIPVKTLLENNDICSPFICKISNNSILNCTFPASLKMAEITLTDLLAFLKSLKELCMIKFTNTLTHIFITVPLRI